MTQKKDNTQPNTGQRFKPLHLPLPLLFEMMVEMGLTAFG